LEFYFYLSSIFNYNIDIQAQVDLPKENQCTTRWLLNGSSIKSGTWNIPEHPGTSNNDDNYEKNMQD